MTRDHWRQPDRVTTGGFGPFGKMAGEGDGSTVFVPDDRRDKHFNRHIHDNMIGNKKNPYQIDKFTDTLQFENYQPKYEHTKISFFIVH